MSTPAADKYIKDSPFFAKAVSNGSARKMIEPIGVLTGAAGIVSLFLGRHAPIVLLLSFSLLGAAAAALVGGANIQPAHFLLAFCIAALAVRPQDAGPAIACLKPGKPGFWLLCFVSYGIVSAFFLPRLFAGVTQIIPLGTSEYAETGFTVPLGPVSSNLTQSVYMAANLICFCVVSGAAVRTKDFEVVTKALIAVCAGNVAFALLDLATYSTGTQSVLDFMRNARYTMHHEEEVFGLKRIVGSFTEASVFSRTTLGALGFCGTLWLCGYRPAISGPLAIASFLLVAFSTSSSGVAGLLPVVSLLYLTAFWRSGVRPDARFSSAFVLGFPPLLALAVLFTLLSPGISAFVSYYLDIVVLSKHTTSSGIERASWNIVAWQNTVDTWGLGVGLGTARTSSLGFALLSHVGLLGSVLYGAFVVSAFLTRRGVPRSHFSDVRLAARNGCLGLMVGDLLVNSTIDQGLLFFALAALACAEPKPASESTAPSRTRGTRFEPAVAA